MLKYFVPFLIIGLSQSAPQQGYKDAYIVRYDSNNIGVGGYDFNVETSDGFKREETGQVLNEGSDAESLSVRGSYSYIGQDGNTYHVEYIADENGFQPIGDHLHPGVGASPTQLVRGSPKLTSAALG